METVATPQSFKSNSFLTASGKQNILSGIITGQVAGLIMAVVIMLVFAIFLNQHLLYPVQVIGSAVYGESALVGFNWKAIFVGLLLHQLGPALVWGLAFGVFAKLLSVQTVNASLTLGLFIGVVSMYVDVYFLVPRVMNYFHGVDIWSREVPLVWDWTAHLIFGLSFAAYPQVLRKLQDRARGYRSKNDEIQLT